MLTEMWVDREEDLDRLDFTERYMKKLYQGKMLSNVVRDSKAQIVYKALRTEFFHPPGGTRIPVKFGGYELAVEKKDGTKSAEHFVVRAVQEG